MRIPQVPASPAYRDIVGGGDRHTMRRIELPRRTGGLAIVRVLYSRDIVDQARPRIRQDGAEAGRHARLEFGLKRVVDAVSIPAIQPLDATELRIRPKQLLALHPRPGKRS